MRHRATYSPEDNKLRIYPDWGDPDFNKEDAKAVGYRWASKQECYVCPRWTPAAEDYALTLVDDIEDEDYSPTERAADRAERFSGYRDKRSAEAGDHADTFEAGPSVFGHQNQQRAERQAARHDRQRVNAVSQWSKAEYWQQRTTGVISHALYKAQPEVRRGRILKLEAEQRNELAAIEKEQKHYDGWKQVAEMEGADILLPLNDAGYVIGHECNDAQRLAYTIANQSQAGGRGLPHPTSESANAKYAEVHSYSNGRAYFSAYDFLTDEHFIGEPFERMTPKQYADYYLGTVSNPAERNQRWLDHYTNRLAYENAMLENEGGKVSEVEIVPGGFIGKHQVHGVSKSPKTGRVTSVKLLTCQEPWGRTRTDENGQPVYFLRSFNIERLGRDAYRPPTPEELATFQTEQAAAKKAKASKPKSPPLINPTDEDAERLQKLWNDRANERRREYNKRQGYDAAELREEEVCRITQAQYSAVSKGSYARAETVEICENGERPRRRYGERIDNNPIAFKVRKTCGGGGFTHGADRVIIITDKPQKPIPLDWAALECDTASCVEA